MAKQEVTQPIHKTLTAEVAVVFKDLSVCEQYLFDTYH